MDTSVIGSSSSFRMDEGVLLSVLSVDIDCSVVVLSGREFGRGRAPQEKPLMPPSRHTVSHETKIMRLWPVVYPIVIESTTCNDANECRLRLLDIGGRKFKIQW